MRGEARAKKDIPPAVATSSFMSVFIHADAVDVALMALGLVGAVGDGLSTPVRMLIFSHLANDLGSGPDQLHEFCSKINEVRNPSVHDEQISYFEHHP